MTADELRGPDVQGEQAPADTPAAGTRAARVKRTPLYPRLLRLRNVHPNAWQRAVLGEGALALAAVLVLADAASAWTLLVLPAAVAVVVKAHDLLAGMLKARAAQQGALVDPDDRSPQLGVKYKDLAALRALADAGADLNRPREVLYFCYAPDEDVAKAMANVAAGRGFTVEVHEPSDDEPSWSVVCRTTCVVTPELVRENGDFFDDLAARYDAEHDGWEAAL